ncbi:hypothetical protein M434DRAFT_7954 [Hypoxylon sp. CO27-5]|nr:hypothetical protein M434DRAFT_7954 [Hypoxylon sp. CO27-5]
MSTDTTAPAEPRPTRLTFGVELEFLVPFLEEGEDDPLAHIEGLPPVYRVKASLREGEGRMRFDDEFIHDGIHELLTSRGLSTRIKQYKYDSDFEQKILAKYTHWRVADDASIRELGRGDSGWDVVEDDFLEDALIRGLGKKELPVSWTNKYSWAGVEVISPVEHDVPEAFAAIDYARGVLTSAYRCRVNSSTGLHVHVGQRAERFPLQPIRRIASLIWSAENLLVTLNHPSRPANYFTRTFRQRSRLARGRESGPGPRHERVRADEPGATYAGRPFDEPRLCLHYIASDLRHGEEPISWREMSENNKTEQILAFLETREEGCFDPFQYIPGTKRDSTDSERTIRPGSPENQIDNVLNKAPNLDKEIALRAAEMYGSGLEAESPRETFRSRTIPRIRLPHHTAEELEDFAEKMDPYGGGGLSFNDLAKDPGVWEGVSQLFQSPSSCDIEYLLNPGARGYVSFRAYSCSRIIEGEHDRTIEFRGAEGTLGNWVVTWAKICIGLVRFAVRAPPDEFLRIVSSCDIADREDGIFDIIDLLDAIGLPAEAAAAEKRIEQNREAWELEYVETEEDKGLP